MLWGNIYSKHNRRRLLYRTPLCELLSSESESDGPFRGTGGRFKHFAITEQANRVVLSKDDLKEKWPSRSQFFYQFGLMIEWCAEQCRDEPWSLMTEADDITDFDPNVHITFSFANDVVAIAFKLVWQ